MRTPSAVGVDYDLAASEAGVAHGASDDEVPAGVDVVLSVLVEVPDGASMKYNWHMR